MPYSSRMSQIMNHQMAKESGLTPLSGPFTGLVPAPLQQLQTQKQVSTTLAAAGQGNATIQVNSLIQSANGQNKLIKIRNF